MSVIEVENVTATSIEAGTGMTAIGVVTAMWTLTDLVIVTVIDGKTTIMMTGTGLVTAGIRTRVESETDIGRKIGSAVDITVARATDERKTTMRVVLETRVTDPGVVTDILVLEWFRRSPNHYGLTYVDLIMY